LIVKAPDVAQILAPACATTGLEDAGYAGAPEGERLH